HRPFRGAHINRCACGPWGRHAQQEETNMALATLQDPIEVKKQVNETLIAHSYFKLNKHGDRVADDTKMKVDVYDAVKKKIARAREEVSKNSFTNGELYAHILPDAPGTDPKEL